jgi:hypothetical protein
MTHRDTIHEVVSLEQLSRAYLASGLSLLPIAVDGTKAPLAKLLPLIGDVRRKEVKPSWIPFQTRYVFSHELGAWMDARAGVGIIGGHISGDLEIIDLDAPDLCQLWRDMVDELMPGLLDRLPCVLTPKQGWHVYYRCEVIEANQKLAETADGTTLIETRGEGGYVIAPGSPLACHPLKKPYQLIRGDLTRIPPVSADERHILLNAARSFNERPQKTVYQSQGSTSANGDRPGDDYNRRVHWHDLMTSIGCIATGRRGDATLWRRPGKTTPGHSAITGNGDDKLYVFSSNFSPFEPHTAYDRFGAYATWFHGGDLSAAAKALATLGYGRQSDVSAGSNGQPQGDAGERHDSSEDGDDQEQRKPSKPTIQLSTNMTAVVSRMQATIRDHPNGPFLYQRAHQLSMIIQGTKPPKWLDRAPDAPLIHPADKAYIRELASFAAEWVKWDGRKKAEVKTLPPPWAIETLMARPRWSFPPLEGIICAPTLRPDGSILDIPGYDQDTGLYLYLDERTFPPIPQHPTLEDTRLCVQLLREVFTDFPFLADHHRSAALAAVLSIVARFTIKGKVPFFAVRSTTRGAGKGLLIDSASVIATGRHAPRWAQTLDEEEERKRLITIAMSGDAVLHIDNITHPLGSGPLDMAMTAEAITERIMASHAERTAPIKAVFFGSGNNMVFQSDMARRVVPIDLAPTQERPDEREDFTHHPLLTWVLQERPRLVVAALTIIKAYIDAGRPKQPGIKAFGSYEQWSDLIRQSLIWAGEPDPCLGRGDIEAESDPKYEMQKVVLTAWYDRYGDAPKTLKEVKDDIDNHTTRELDDNDKWTGRWIVDPGWRDLQSALLALTRRGNDLDLRAIGYAFRSWQGRVLANLQLRKVGEGRLGAYEWQVKKL